MTELTADLMGYPSGFDMGRTLTDGRTDGRDGRIQDQVENSRLGTAATPVDYTQFLAGQVLSDSVWLPSDESFRIFLDAFTPGSFCAWEWRVFQQHLNRKENPHA